MYQYEPVVDVVEAEPTLDERRARSRGEAARPRFMTEAHRPRGFHREDDEAYRYDAERRARDDEAAALAREAAAGVEREAATVAARAAASREADDDPFAGPRFMEGTHKARGRFRGGRSSPGLGRSRSPGLGKRPRPERAAPRLRHGQRSGQLATAGELSGAARVAEREDAAMSSQAIRLVGAKALADLGLDDVDDVVALLKGARRASVARPRSPRATPSRRSRSAARSRPRAPRSRGGRGS